LVGAPNFAIFEKFGRKKTMLVPPPIAPKNGIALAEKNQNPIAYYQGLF
jgi:hypothetical protein